MWVGQWVVPQNPRLLSLSSSVSVEKCVFQPYCDLEVYLDVSVLSSKFKGSRKKTIVFFLLVVSNDSFYRQ